MRGSSTPTDLMDSESSVRSPRSRRLLKPFSTAIELTWRRAYSPCGENMWSLGGSLTAVATLSASFVLLRRAHRPGGALRDPRVRTAAATRRPRVQPRRLDPGRRQQL